MKEHGSFLFWRWERWAVGGGGGVEWWFCGKQIYPGEHSPLWMIFNIQKQKSK